MTQHTDDDLFPVDSATRECCSGIGGHTQDCSMNSCALRQGIDGRWLGRRGIFRHFQPTDKVAIQNSKASGELVSHVMSTAVSGEFAGDVVGELIRWADGQDGTVTFEARINGVEDGAGIADIVAYSYDDLWPISKVTNDLRYEWAAILEGRWVV